MAKVVLLLPPDTEVAVGRSSTERLTAFGVSHLSVLRDDVTVAVVLEGWSFDPSRSLDRVIEVLGTGSEVRVLHELAHVAVHAP